METPEAKDTSQCVRVAVNIRPLVTSELLIGCTDCVTVVPGEPQVQIGSHVFTFDYVFGSGGYASSRIFDECVAPLVDALFQGYNGTVLAYGQTGSGKTYTMGTNYNGEEQTGGVIPMVMNTIFSRAETMKKSAEFLIRVSFIEIFKEEVFDLLDQNAIAFCKADGAAKLTGGGPARVPIQIRETVHGGITLAGVTEAEVRTKEEMASFLLRGSVARATGSTKMNSQSSRSHAIFTISLEQRRIANCSSGSTKDDGDDILCAKLHLVDLAGSERAKRTGADEMRLREGIHINKGLLALGNVISALGDEKKRKEACVSPADTNAEETLNTLKYANRARNIQNKAIVNRDPMAAQMQRMRSQIEQLQAELLYVRGDSGAPFEELQILKSKISLLEASNAELQREVKERQIHCEQLTQSAIDAQVERDRLILKIESSKNGRPWNEIDNSDQDLDLVKKYVSKIQELEAELLHLQSSSNSKHGEPVDYLGLDYGETCSEDSDIKSIDTNGEAEVKEKELEHSSLQEKLDMELKELDKKLEQKEAEMKRFAGVDTSVLKQHYEKKVHELELEKKALQKEIEALQRSLSNISSNSDESAQKLKEDYLQKLNLLESQVAVLKKKQDAQSQLLRQKQKSDDAAKRLQDEIHRIKTQKVQLQQKIKQESEQFRLWKASREKEVLQLKKEGRRNEYEMHKLLALNQRQKMVLQRKTEEAAMATKRLKDLLESRKTSRDMAGSGSTSSAGFQALMQAIEHELEVTVRVHEVRSEYERQMQERAKMASEVAELKLKTLRYIGNNDCPQKMSPGARNSRIFALENMLATSSSTLVSMASQLSEAEERERTFSGRGRWNQVRSLADAKNIMNFLFNLASSSRCQQRDREVECREKDAEIRELKEKVVNLVRQIELQKSELRQLESQNNELVQQEKLMKLALEHPIGRTDSSVSNVLSSIDGHAYDLRQKAYILLLNNLSILDVLVFAVANMCQSFLQGNRSSLIYSSGWNKTELEEEDMDTSDSDCSYQDKTDTDYGSVCCSCSKRSSCKTNKCECRALGGSCGVLCGCDPLRCSNKETSTKNQFPSLDVVGNEGNTLGTDEAESNQTLASQGAMLLQNALSEKPIQSKDEGESKRKPLSDIGNTRAKSNAPKHNQRKKWRKSTIQLVPVAPTTQASNTDAPIKTSQPGKVADASAKADNTVGEIDTPPLKLPRAMRSALTNGNTLRERNSETNDSAVDLTTPPAPKSPLRQAKPSDEKEN
ncbi:Kinesin-like protein FRA1 [Capsicum chinense]|nr:Kinesin-like protein FRA1 [Capsicum chinense]